MVPTPFWDRQWSCHLNEREKTKDNQHDAKKRNGQVRWPKVIVKYEAKVLRAYV